MHDRNGKLLNKGDRVLIEAEIAECYATADYCNVQLSIGKDKDHGPHNVHGTVTLNSKQVELIEN